MRVHLWNSIFFWLDKSHKWYLKITCINYFKFKQIIWKNCDPKPVHERPYIHFGKGRSHTHTRVPGACKRSFKKCEWEKRNRNINQLKNYSKFRECLMDLLYAPFPPKPSAERLRRKGLEKENQILFLTFTPPFTPSLSLSLVNLLFLRFSASTSHFS